MELDQNRLQGAFFTRERTLSILFGRLRTLRVFGCVSAVLYLLVGIMFWTDSAFDRTRIVEILGYSIFATLTLLYFAGIRLVRDTSLRTVIVFACLFAILGFMAGPIDSTDVFFYIAQGWVQSHYGGNPYTLTLRDIPDGLQDPMIASRWMALNRNPWLDEPLPYGFAFALITRTLTFLGGGNWWLTLGLFGLLNLTIYAATAFLLWKIAALIPGVEPKLVLYLYAWSPLVVLEYLVNAHNDMIMASLIVLAFYFLLRGRVVWILPSLMLAGFVKYAAFALVPSAVVFVFRRYRWKTLGKTLAISAVLSMVVSMPYIWELPAFKVKAVVEQFTESSGSLHAFMRFTLRRISDVVSSNPVPPGTFGPIVKIILWAAVTLFTIYQFRRAVAATTRKVAPVEVATRWTSILFAVIFVGSTQFYSWYIGMLFPLSLVGAGKSVLTEVVVMLSGTHLLFTFMRSKAIGYFLLATGLPVIWILWRNRSSNGADIPFLPRPLPVVNPPRVSIPSVSEVDASGK